MVLVEAHRGDSLNAPENTVASILSNAQAADLTEFDVRVTADGHLLLMHDSTVNRTTNGTGAVAGLTLAQIQSLDAGSWFSPAYAGEPVPTLAEAINASLAVGVEPLVERKTGAAALYHQEFTTLGLSPSDFRVISFDWDFLNDLNALEPAYNLGALGSGPLVQATIDSLKALGVDFIDWSHASIGQSTVDLVQGNGMELHVWTVDNPSRMQVLIDLGVDGITTNRPAVLRELVDLASVTADLNQDGFVDAADWLLYNAGRGTDLSGLTHKEAFARGDLDRDFDNDITDFVTFKSLYEAANGAGSLGRHGAVPEASTACLTLTIAIGLGGNRCRARTG